MNIWCRPVAKTSVTPTRPRNDASVEPGWACRGAAVWAKLSVVCSETISPATARAAIMLRRIAPISRPTMTSRNTQAPRPPTVSGRPGNVWATSGVMARDNRNAKASRTRGGTTVSPIPGRSMTIAPTRTKTSEPAHN